MGEVHRRAAFKILRNTSGITSAMKSIDLRDISQTVNRFDRSQRGCRSIDRSETLRILVFPIGDWVHGPSRGHFDLITEKLAQRGHKVMVWHFRLNEGGVKKQRCSQVALVHGRNVSVRDPSLYYALNSILEVPAVVGAIRRHRTQVIVSENLLHGLVAFLFSPRGTLRIFDLGDYFPDAAQAHYRSRFVRSIVRLCVSAVTFLKLRLCDVCISPHPLLLKYIKEMFPGKPTHWISNGVDTKLFRSEAPDPHLRSLLGLSENTICFVGLIEPWVDFDTVLRGIKRLLEGMIDANLLVVGPSNGPIQDRLRTLAKRMGIEGFVRWTGLVSQSDVPKYINLASLCVMPFNVNDFTCSFVVPAKFFEYSACGKPILSSPLPGISNLGAKHVIVYRSAEHFSKICGELFVNRKYRERLGSLGGTFAEQFDIEAITDDFIELAACQRAIDR